MTLAPHEALADDAVERILQAAGNVPADFARGQLRADLEGVVALYRTGRDRRRAPAERRKWVNQTVKAAEKLKAQISHNLLLWVRHHGAIDRLIADVREEGKFPEKLTAMLGVGQVSAFENLISGLAHVFEQHFPKRRATYTWNPVTGEASGAFIDFTEAALAELRIDNDGTPYSRKAIANALTTRKTGRR